MCTSTDLLLFETHIWLKICGKYLLSLNTAKPRLLRNQTSQLGDVLHILPMHLEYIQVVGPTIKRFQKKTRVQF